MNYCVLPNDARKIRKFQRFQIVKFLKKNSFFDPFCKNCKKFLQNKFLASKLRNDVLFHLLLLCTQGLQPSNFLRVNCFATFSIESKSASNSAFVTHIQSIWRKNFWSHTFCKLLSQTRTIRLKKSKKHIL